MGMMKGRRDLTLVVGGGPAGSACAWKLASSGRPCILLDKHEFPRDKVCGGILSGRAAKMLTASGMVSSEELDSLTLRKHRSITFWHRDERLRTYTADSHPVRVVSRRLLDSFLLERAADAGADVRTGCCVETVGTDHVDTSEGERFGFFRLVGADGCNSVIRRLISARRGSKTGMGLEYFVPLAEPCREPEGLEVHFGHIPYGYVWMIPGRETINIGAGAVGSPAPPSVIVDALEGFAGSLSVDTSEHQLHGAPIPSMVLDRNLGRGRFYLAGDAAGLVDQVSGEGIAHAVESGMMVAECIVAGDSREKVLGRKGSCIDIVAQSSLYRHLLFSRLTMGTAMLSLRDSSVFAEGYWNVVAGVETYHEMFRRVLA